MTLIREGQGFTVHELPNRELNGDDDVTEVIQVCLLWDSVEAVISNIYAPSMWQVAGEHRADNILTGCVNVMPGRLYLIAGDFNVHHGL